MISNSDSKFIKSLQLKKYRLQEGFFVVEGAKNVLELLKSDYEVEKLFCLEQFSKNYAADIGKQNFALQLVTEKQLSRVGTFKNNNAALALAKIPRRGELVKLDGIVLAFDRLKDPGNMGTIIRVADWYGIQNIVCSEDSVDCFNPKVIAATMGSFTRVDVFYQDLMVLVQREPSVYATTLSGDDIHKTAIQAPAVILFGNESQGIRAELLASVHHQITIPGYGGAESLNVAISTAIVCDNLPRG